jgi:2-polyprenyl-3-methyl-5-hydroxy-6-metoxy-1,4-benzoquinol methylase
MHYDPIKDSVGGFFNRSPFLRKIFYGLLDLLLLRSWHIHKEFKAWQKKNGNSAHILDAGSGFGQYSYFMSSRSSQFNILSVDVKEDYMADCNSFFKKIGKTNVFFRTEDLTRFRQPDAFNFILCVDVMEHILEDVEVFKNFYIDLKPGGMVLISTPSDKGGSDVDHNSGESFIGEHVRDGYNIDEIQQKLKIAGFHNTDARYSYGTPGKIAWRLSMKWPIQILNVSKIFFVIIPFYYILVYPFCFVLNWLDTKQFHKEGTGLIVKAWK